MPNVKPEEKRTDLLFILLLVQAIGALALILWEKFNPWILLVFPLSVGFFIALNALSSEPEEVKKGKAEKEAEEEEDEEEDEEEEEEKKEPAPSPKVVKKVAPPPFTPRGTKVSKSEPAPKPVKKPSKASEPVKKSPPPPPPPVVEEEEEDETEEPAIDLGESDLDDTAEAPVVDDSAPPGEEPDDAAEAGGKEETLEDLLGGSGEEPSSDKEPLKGLFTEELVEPPTESEPPAEGGVIGVILVDADETEDKGLAADAEAGPASEEEKK